MTDFSKLLRNIKPDATKRPVNGFQAPTQGNIPAEPKNAVETKINPIAGANAKKPGNPGEPLPELSPLQAGKLLQEKIMKGECSIWAINHAMKRNAPPEEIALIAVKGLALVTSDPMIFKTVSDAWRERYGMIIEENPPYKITYCKNNE